MRYLKPQLKTVERGCVSNQSKVDLENIGLVLAEIEFVILHLPQELEFF